MLVTPPLLVLRLSDAKIGHRSDALCHPGLDETARERVIAAKRRGERALRASGLGYTIVRPGALVEETGGYKALVFDQGTRISQVRDALKPECCLNLTRNCFASGTITPPFTIVGDQLRRCCGCQSEGTALS